MLTPVRMAKIGVLALESRATALTQALARQGAVQVEPPAPSLGLDAAVSRPLIARYEAIEERLAELASHLGLSLAPKQSPFELEVEPVRDIDEIEGRVNEIIGDVEHLQKQLAVIAEHRRTLSAQLEELLLLEPVDWPLEELRATKHLSVRIGVLRDVNINRVVAALGALPHELVRLPGPATGWDLVLVFAARAAEEQIDRILAAANFTPLHLPEGLTGPAASASDAVWEKQTALAESRRELTERLRTVVADDAGEVETLWERARAARLVLSAQQSFGRTAKLVYVTGWVPKERVPVLRSALQERLGTAAYVEFRDPLPDEPGVPVQLRNPSIFRPFEEVVTTYALPSPREIDPTPVVAVTYLLMFGAMFGDVGQGLVLAVAGYWAARKWASLKNIGRIIGMCGIASMVFGAFYGSIFGAEGEVIPGLFFPLVEHHTTVVEANLMMLGGITVGFGIVMLSVGIVFNIVNAARAREYGVALFDAYGVAGLLFYWCALVWTGLKLTGTGKAAAGVLGLATLALLVVLFVREPIIRAFERRKEIFEGGIAFFLVQGVIDLMDTVVRFLSNTVSFVRVAAFGLTHAAMFMAVYTIGVMVTGAPHGFGYVVAFIVGNVFVIVMEGLIVSIQCLRLEYYEIFGKFFRGGGTPFAPLTAH